MHLDSISEEDVNRVSSSRVILFLNASKLGETTLISCT